MTAVTYELDGAIARITMDDGKVNALSPQMLAELGEALDAAESAAAIILAGRDGVFSAGFSLPVLQAGGPDAAGMLASGFALAERLLSSPAPVVIACTGHAIAMGSFLLLTGDYRIGVGGPYKITANEVAIGLTMPHAAIEICRQRLTPAHFHRAVALAEVYTPDGAAAAGFLDQVAIESELAEVVTNTANGLASLQRGAHSATKMRARAGALRAIREGMEADRLVFGS